MNLIERLRQEGLSASIRNLFSHPTPERLAKVLGRAHENDIPPNLIQSSASVITPDMLSLVALSQEEINRIVAAVPGGAPNVQDIYPLTPLQEGLLFHHLSASAGDPYLMPLIIGFDARERLDAFMAALHAVIARHDILRTALFWEGVGEPLQIVWRDVSVVLEDVPLDPLGADPVQQLRTRFDPSAFRLDIRMAPMMRAFAAHDERQNRWLLMLIFHHLVSDHAADDVLLKEVRAHLDGAANWLPAPIPYRNFVARARFGGGADEHEAFFRNMLANYSEPASPFGLLERAKDSAPFHEAAIDLSPSLGARLRRQARALGVSVASLCHLAFAQLLSRASGRDDIVFGTVLFGRTEGGARIDDAVGMFINTLPLRAHLSNSPVAGAIHDLHALLSQLMTHERASLALAQRCSGVVAPTPLFCALLNYRHSQPEVSVERDTILPGAALLFAEERANYPLVLSIDDFGDRFRLMAQTRGVSPSMICNHMRTTFESLADALEHAPHTPVSGLEVFSPDQRLRLISEWSGAAVAFHEEKSIVELFEDCVADAPNAVAVAFRGEALTYKQLNERADLLAAHLMRCGVGLESVAGVCLERSFETIVVLLAILKTGGAYLPLDPDYPPERLSFMVADAAPAVIVTRTHLREALPSNGRILDLDQKRSSADFSSRDRKPRINAQNIAYVTYTSGSTGRPKGVAVTHLAVLRLAKDERLAAIGEARNAVLQHSPLAFDASTFEIWVPLLNGGRIAIAPADARSGDEGFGQALRHDQVTTLWLTAALFHRIVEDRLSDLKGVKRLLVGGDVVSQTHANKLLAAYPWMELWNGYGPTENTTFSTLHRISPSIDANIPIGRPICGSTVYILDKKLDPMPVGAIGELYVGGAGLARGYSGRSDLTAERFVPNLFGAEGERLYRTGDLARFNEAGELEFLGRADRQLKIRGFRIEPGEIEAALTSLTQIREAVVIPREDSQGERRLAAYVVMTEGYADDAEDLRKVLARSLPSFMLPSRIVAVDAIPITPSGKLDRAALANISDQPSPANVFIAPRNSVEWLIAREFSNVLGVDRVGVEDNFFELGGHSLSAMRLAERIRRTLGRKLSPTAIFEAPTVSAIAAVLRDQVTSTSLRVELNGGGATPPLYCVHPAGGSVMRYRELAEALDGVSPVIGLQSRALSDSAHVDVSIDDMASAYVTEIRSGHPSDTPYCLVGWSSGGVIVAAMAEKLEALGERVAFLGIVDSYAYPDEDEFADHTPLESFIELAGLEGVDAKAALSEADRTVLIEARSGRTVREQYVFAAEWGVARGYLCDASPELIDAIYSDMENTVRLIRAHDLRDVSCPLHFWRARRSGCSPIAPWRRIAGGGVDVVDIDNDHDGVVADPALIAEIRENMNRIDREWRRYAATPEMRPDHMGRRSADSKEEAGY